MAARYVGVVAVVTLIGGALLGPTSPGSARAQGGQGAVAGRLTILEDGEPRSNHSQAVVYLEDVPGDVPRSARVKAKIRQENRTFIPGLLVVPTGSEVEFPNNDHIFHNVFSLSRTRRFDLGLYRSGSSKSVTFRREGVVDVYCNIHPEMEAKILVLDTVHFDQANRRGGFRIDGVPAGTYTLVGWQPHGEPHRQSVTIRPGESTRVSFQLTAGDGPRTHTRKDGTPYGRYR